MPSKALKEEFDRLGDLDEILAPHKAEIAEREKLRKIIVARFENEPAEEPCVAEGDRWIIKLSAKTKRKVFKKGAMKRLHDLLQDRFWPICDVAIGKFEDHVTILDRGRFVEELQIGHRTIEAVAKPAAAKAA